MIIQPVNSTVLRVVNDETLWTIVQSYPNYDGIAPTFTIIMEDAHASPVVVLSDYTREELENYFKVDLLPLFKN